MSFLKFIALATVKLGVQFGLVLVIAFGSEIPLLKSLFGIITNGFANDVVSAICLGIAYYVCTMLAEKMDADKPFFALLVTDIVIQGISLVLNLCYLEFGSILTNVISIVIGVVFIKNRNN